MNDAIKDLSTKARRAVSVRSWQQVQTCANAILALDADCAEGHFLVGLAHAANVKPIMATASFTRALELDPHRYDAAIELANQFRISRRNADANELLDRYARRLSCSPMYSDMAGTVYTNIGMPEKAWALYEQANKLQPGIDLFQANLATCAVFLGKIEIAKVLYKQLLKRFPAHQRNHYQLSRLERATDLDHVRQMQEILRRINLPSDQNIFMYYAIGKELEDLGHWQEAFAYYRLGGDAVSGVANYDVKDDLDLIDAIIRVCSAEWFSTAPGNISADPANKIPIFIVGLPRTGTTLTERILSSHTRVQSLGETTFMQMALRRASGIQTQESFSIPMLEALSVQDMAPVAAGYLNAVRYRLNDKPMFIEKLPFNFLYLGLIAKAFPRSPLIHLRRNPMDTCFAMYKQVFTFPYKFSYSLEALGRYYVAYERLRRHWQSILGDRFIEIQYEDFVADQESQTRMLLERVGLDFEPACLEFEKNVEPSTTASSVQIREKIHARSIGHWTHFRSQLEPLRRYLDSSGIALG